MKKILFTLSIVLIACICKSQDQSSVEAIIESFVSDYKNDRYASEARVVGIEVPEHGEWTVRATGEKKESGYEVELKRGIPKEATYVYKIEYPTLMAIYEGTINALTAQGKAFATDYTPMSVYEMDDFYPSLEEDGALNAFSFHFWTKGFPEIVAFRPDATREAHGSSMVIFYYEKGLRTGWYNIMPGERVRDDAREQAAPFPMMGIAIKGTANGIVDGEPVTISAGNTVFIPAGVAHKWWNDTDEPVEVILVMWGDGA